MLPVKYDDIINKHAGFITSPVYRIPNREYLPSGLHLTAIEANNLKLLGCSENRITTGGIAFSYAESYYSTIGELFERYAGASVNFKNMYKATYYEMQDHFGCAFDPTSLNPYKPFQYKLSGFPFIPLTREHEIWWVKGENGLTKEPAYIPASLVYLSFIDKERFFLPTSTGLATGVDKSAAIQSAFLENVERDAFSRFWYHQKTCTHKAYSADAVLRAFPDDRFLQELYGNKKIHLVTYDISRYALTDTVFVVMYFKHRGKLLQSCGCASRFDKQSAICKAAMEAYQGVEYAISLQEKRVLSQEAAEKPYLVDSFDKHFSFYNAFPELRMKVPVLKNALEGNLHDSWKEEPAENEMLRSLDGNHLKNRISQFYYVDITPPDIKQLGLYVMKAINPELILLTATHSIPFLGMFDDCRSLFLELPHCFP